MTYGTLNADAHVTSWGDTFAGLYGFKNRIINGAMAIDQRNAGGSVTPTSSAYTIDRWVLAITQSSKLSVQQNAGSVTPPAGFANYLGMTSQSAYSVSSTDFFIMVQVIEGLNVADLSWGTSNAKTVTLSFQVYSSLTGTFGGSLENSAENRAYPFTYTVSSANTWTTIAITIPGDTTGTWLTNNGAGIKVNFGLGVGSSKSGTAGAWAGTQYLSATGATSVVGTSGATFYITGVQLEKGTTATSFDYRPYGTELQLCQRYYFDAAKGVNLSINGYCFSTTQYNAPITFPVQMRASPSLSVVTGSGYYTLDTGGGNALTSPNIFRPTQYGALVYFTVASGTAGYAGGINMTNAACDIAFSAEL